MTTRTHIRNMLAITAMSFFGAVSAAGMAPAVQVKATTEEVLAVIAANNDRQALNELAETKIVPHFDFKRMTQLAVGRTWSQATPQQQQALVREFRRLLVRTYTNALASVRPDKSSVEMLPTRPLASEDEVMVKTRVVESGRKPVSIDYHMENTPEGWKVFDVTVESISLVSNYRQSFKTQVEQGGIDGLIRALGEKNRTLRGRGASGRN